MNLEVIKKEIENKAKGHKHPIRKRVLMAGFQGLVLHEFVDKAYCHLLGRMPDDAEKDEVYKKLYSGQMDRFDWLEFVLQSEECKKRGLDTSDLKAGILAYRQAKEKDSFGSKLKKRLKATVKIWKDGV